MDPRYEREVTSLFHLICSMVNGRQAEVSMQGLQILNNDTILMNYVIHHSQRLRIVEECLNQTRMDFNNNNNTSFHTFYLHVETHWNESIREIGEALFDHLLDYV